MPRPMNRADGAETDEDPGYIPTDQQLDWGAAGDLGLDPMESATGKVYRGSHDRPPADHRDVWVVADDNGAPTEIRVYDFATRGWITMVQRTTEGTASDGEQQE